MSTAAKHADRLSGSAATQLLHRGTFRAPSWLLWPFGRQYRGGCGRPRRRLRPLLRLLGLRLLSLLLVRRGELFGELLR